MATVNSESAGDSERVLCNCQTRCGGSKLVTKRTWCEHTKFRIEEASWTPEQQNSFTLPSNPRKRRRKAVSDIYILSELYTPHAGSQGTRGQQSYSIYGAVWIRGAF